MNDLDYIDSYFTNQLTAEKRKAFEQSLQTDPQLADAVAFYLLTKQTAQKEAHQARKVEWANLSPEHTPARWLGGWAYAAAAACAVLLLGLGWYFMRSQPSATELADAYIVSELQELTVAMDARSDSLTKGVELFNTGNLTQAATIFGTLYSRDSTNTMALQYAGVVSLRQKKYDKAISQFHRLSQRTDLVSNPAMFYEALALIKRNRPGDADKARQLLQLVVDKKLEGEKLAKEWIKKL